MKEGWEYKKLVAVADFYRGLTYKREDEVDSSDNCVLRSNNIDLESMSLNFEELKYIRPDFVIPEDKKLKANSVFVCMSNGSKQHVGKVAYVNEDMNYAFGGFMGLIVPKPQVRGKYIYYVCRSSLFRHFLDQIGNGIGITNLRFSDLNEFSIPFPPLSEQRHIVEELDLLSSTIEKKKAQLKELDNLAQSLFYEMFGESSYEKVTLEEVVEITSSLVSPLEPPYADMLHVSPSNIISNTGDIVDCIRAKEEKLISGKYTFTKGMVLYSKIRPNLNKVAIPTFDGICSADMYPLSVKEKATNIFVWRLLLSKDFLDYAIKQSGRARMPKLNREALFSYSFSLPPLSLQQQFASKIEVIEHQKELIKQSIKEVETLFNSRMDYYFN